MECNPATSRAWRCTILASATGNASLVAAVIAWLIAIPASQAKYVVDKKGRRSLARCCHHRGTAPAAAGSTAEARATALCAPRFAL
jgi:hypothetical protein